MNKKKRFQVVIMVAAVFLCGIIYVCLGPGRAAVLADDGEGQTFVAGGARTAGADSDGGSEVDSESTGADASSVRDDTVTALSASGPSGTDAGDTAASDGSRAGDTSDAGRSAGVFIYICGAVKKPGVYTFDSPPRVVEVVEKAGGFTKKADQASVNLASQVDDGAQVVVYEKSKDGQVAANPAVGASSGTEASLLIDINTAGHEELMQIPGVGDAKASAIEAYRSEHGRFEKPEDLMQISGIKQGTFDKIKDYIKV